MITTQELAQKLLKANPNLSTMDRYQIEKVVREYIQEKYLEAFSRVRAGEAVGKQIDPKDKKNMEDLQPHYLNFAPVARAVEQILSGQSIEVLTPVQPQQVDPTQMSTSEYAQWREQNSPFKASAGLLN